MLACKGICLRNKPGKYPALKVGRCALDVPGLSGYSERWGCEILVEAVDFGQTKDGQKVQVYTLRNYNGLEVRCINYGCRLTHILVPQPKGEPVDVLLGYDDLASYEEDTAGHGAIIGRYAGRIIGGRFTIDGQEFQLDKNAGENFLHGSLAHRVFTTSMVGENSLSFQYVSPDGEDGFPGELTVQVIYTLTDEDELVMDVRATTTAPTHVNLTNHSYFNMAGEDAGSIGPQRIWLNSKQFLEARPDLCATGQLLTSRGTAFDFHNEKPIGRDLLAEDPQITLAGGYDHTFVLVKNRPHALTLAARVREPSSGRSMEIYTTQPSIQFYTANSLSDDSIGKGGRRKTRQGSFCLETQHYPASPNYPEFPNTLLRPGEKLQEITVYLFKW